MAYTFGFFSLFQNKIMAEAAPKAKQTIDEKLDIALEFKDLGNKFYKEGNFKAAAGKYHRAILYMKVGI